MPRSEPTVRNELAAAIRSGFFGLDGLPDDEDYEIADTVLASPVIRRIQAEAWDEGSEHGYTYRLGEEHGLLTEEDTRGNPYRLEQS